MLTAEEARTLLDSIGAPQDGLSEAEDPPTLQELRDRALIGVMVYTFARVNAVIGMKVTPEVICQIMALACAAPGLPMKPVHAENAKPHSQGDRQSHANRAV